MRYPTAALKAAAISEEPQTCPPGLCYKNLGAITRRSGQVDRRNSSQNTAVPPGRAGADPRYRSLRLACVGCWLLFLAVAPPLAQGGGPAISYLLDLREPPSHLVRVTMTVPQAQPASEIQFPSWNNLYQIRDFARNIQGIQAECDGHAENLERVDLNTWRSGPEACAGLTVRYAVYANEESPFSSVLSTEHAFLNFALLLFYLPRERERGARVKFLLPEGWRIATLLEDGDNEFKAADYDALVDSPAEAGKFQEYSYTQGGATYRVVVHARPEDYTAKRLLESLRKITATETALMGETPFTRYTFIFHFPRLGGGGGMEHRLGTAISIPAADLSRHWGSLEGTAAHEFFHLWNVKRLRPQALEPIDYVHGNNTRDLWFCEGVTSTYEQLSLLRAGLIDRAAFYDRLAGEIRRLQERPAHRWQSVEEAGLEAWLEKYPDYQRPERSISYYNKGALLGFMLDLAIRQATANRASLDDVMRRLNEQFARRGRFYTPKDLRDLVAEFVPACPELDAFFRDYVSGTRELDYAGYLGFAGLRLVPVSASHPSLGFVAARSYDGPIRVEAVDASSSAQKAGLERGDVLLKMNGRALEHLPEEQLRGVKAGERVAFQVRRGNRVLDIRYNLATRGEAAFRVEEITNPTAEQLRIREGWLTGKAASSPGAGQR